MALRTPEDLAELLAADAEDVCSPEQLLARVERRSAVNPRRRGDRLRPALAGSSGISSSANSRRSRLLAVTLAVIVVVAVAVVVSVLRQKSDGTPSAGPGSQSGSSTELPSASPLSTDVNPRPVPAGWRTESLSFGGSSTVAIPRRWYSSSYHGEPSTLSSADRFFSSVALTGRCTSGRRGLPSCTTAGWFPPGTRVAASQVLIVWSDVDAPTPSGDLLAGTPGRTATIDHRPSRLRSGTATDSCPSGSGTEIDAFVQIDPTARVGGRLDMTACLGPQVSSIDRQAVYTMLTTLRLHT